MRLVYRFIFLALFFILSIILIIQAKPGLLLQKWKGQIPRRIVSFGDSYSNNPKLQFDGIRESLKWQPHSNLKQKRDFIPESPRSPAGGLTETHNDDSHGLPPPIQLPDPRKAIPNGLFFPNQEPIEEYPDIDTPLTWTSLLCHKELACDVHDNFAVPNRVGVDKATYINNLTWVDAGSDLKEQVRKWLDFEDVQSSRHNNDGRETLFTVWFGISDVMKFSLLKKREGIVAVEHSLEVLFQQLEKIAARQTSNNRARILIPYVIDVSLLPAYSRLLTQNASPDFSTAAEVQKNAIWLTTLWNQGLELRAKQWENNAQLILWNTHDWFLSEIRAGEELQEIDTTLQPGTFKHANAARDDTTKRGGWKNIKDACIGKRAGRWSVCDHPDSYLMWDDFRLGARAHRRIAKQAMRLIKEIWPTTDSWIHPPSTKEIRDFWQGGGGIL